MDFVHPVEAIVPGVQGRVLAALVETTAELNLATVARLSGASLAQASRVVPGLVELGLVERREVPPSSLFRLVRDHVAAGPLLALARSRDSVLEGMALASAELVVKPISVVVFGSFARGEADGESDIDVVLVRPPELDEQDTAWSDSIDEWKGAIRRMSGNRVEVLEVSSEEMASLLGSRRQVWRDIRSDGIVVFGSGFDTLVMYDDG